MSMDVLVTGAAGRTGRLVLQKLAAQPDVFTAHGLVRDIKRAAEVLPADLVPNLSVGDVCDRDSLRAALKGKQALVVLTSAVPKIDPNSPEGQPPSFYYDHDGMPEKVDFLGGRNQIDIAKEAGVERVLFVGSMGSTEPNNPLNKLGNGRILFYKRKAETYLVESGLPYTVINPGGLLNDNGGEREIIFGRNDELFSIYDRQSCGIPREDVARVVVAALTSDAAANKGIDCIARPKGDGEPTTDFEPLFASAQAF